MPDLDAVMHYWRMLTFRSKNSAGNLGCGRFGACSGYEHTATTEFSWLTGACDNYSMAIIDSQEEPLKGAIPNNKNSYGVLFLHQETSI